MRRAALTLAAVVLLTSVAVPAVAHPGRHDPEATPRVGVLIADHGEPPEYNADTYYSFREFFAHLIEMGFIPRWLTLVDTGTVLHDRLCAGCDEPRDHPELIDAWLRPHDGPAVSCPAPSACPPTTSSPAGPASASPTSTSTSACPSATSGS